MDIRPANADTKSLAAYEGLFQRCFRGASHLDARYLSWLYAQNPVGAVIGCDAWDGDVLAAHYVCVPVKAMIAGHPTRVMLSLNTATHPDYQGKGLFTRLADATYELGERMGIDAVYGVANANSTPGFLRKLGFSLVRPLDACIGVGRVDRVDPREVRANAAFYRDWSPAALEWRIGNPARSYRLVRLDESAIGAEASIGRLGLVAWDELPGASVSGASLPRASVRPHLHLGLRPAGLRRATGWFDIPTRFRPSPLNLIFKPLRSGIEVPEGSSVVLGQLDFDAF